ncbi:MAG: DUF4269 domain-containing protein [Bacteroidota bacterium]
MRFQLLAHLSAFRPVLAGTIPIGIDLPQSDLDLLCEVYDFPAFHSSIREHFGHFAGFRIWEGWQQRLPSCLISFQLDTWPIEIFGQARPVEEQYAFRHMLVENRLLQLGGDSMRRGIRLLKSQGHKTEPAFAQLLGLEGDPYEALLLMEEWSDEQMEAHLKRNSGHFGTFRNDR